MPFAESKAADATATNLKDTPITTCYRSFEEAVAEIERECDVRFRIYDKWVKEGKISAIDAKDRLERLISAWHWLTGSGASKQFELAEGK